MLFLKSASEIGRELRDRVRELRVAKGWSQKEMARRAGLPFSTYRFFEQKGEIALNGFLQICSALGRLAEVSHLLSREAEPPSIKDLTAPKKVRGRTLS